MSGSKDRLRWGQLQAGLQRVIEGIAGGRVVAARSCAGGYSPGLAARLLLDSGEGVFAKAIDGREWQAELQFYTAEAELSARLPADVPAPRLLGSYADGRWVTLVFEHVGGARPSRGGRTTWPGWSQRPAAWHSQGLARSLGLSADHARLGGWAEIAADGARRSRLAARAPWGAAALPELAALESAGLRAAEGDALVHFDLYAHNILLSPGRVVFVDWPWARRGAPFVDLVMLLASAAADGIDPEPYLATAPVTAAATADDLTSVLAAHAGFCLAGALEPGRAGARADLRGQA